MTGQDNHCPGGRYFNALPLAQDLIRCQSVTPIDDGAQLILSKALEDIGFTCQHLPFGQDRDKVNNLFAWRRFGDGIHCCLAGHTDVVPADEATDWTNPPFDGVVSDGVLYGRGVADMKGAVACMVAALSRVTAGAPSVGTLSLLITGDEEADAINGTDKVLTWMQDNDHIPDLCLIGEPTGYDRLGEGIKIGRRGSFIGRLSVSGKAGHSAYPDRANNPLPVLMAMVQALAGHHLDDGSDQFDPSHYVVTSIDVGNRAANVIPGHGRAVFNIRFNNHWTGASLEKKVRAILAKAAKSFTGNWHLDSHISSESFLTDNPDWVDLVADEAHKILGYRPLPNTIGGTSDARFIRLYCPVLEFGLAGRTMHQANESCPVKDLETLTIIYQRILQRLLV